MSHEDERLRALLHDAVSDVDPRDGLADVRRRTRPRLTRRSRRWTPVLVGAGAVAATVVAGTVLVATLGDGSPEDNAPVATEPSSDGPTGTVAGIYYLAETAGEERLFREFQTVPDAAADDEAVLVALQRLTFDAGPDDPDYRTLWPAGSFAAVSIEEDRITVDLGTEAALQQTDASGQSLLGVQQAVYTAEAALGDARPVAFEWRGRPARKVLGARVPVVVERDTLYAVTAPVNISDPAEGLEVEDTLAARGTMASYVNEVRWQLTADGDVVLEGTAPASEVDGPDATATLGAPGWETEIDVSELTPGDYVLEAEVTDTGQTSDKPARYSDTRTVTVR